MIISQCCRGNSLPQEVTPDDENNDPEELSTIVNCQERL